MNQATVSGGAIWVNGPGGATPDLLDNVTVEMNSATLGGGIFVASSGSGRTIDFVNGTVASNNSTGSGGGVIFLSEIAAATFTGTQILNNTAGGPGGGVYAAGTASAVVFKPFVMNSVLIDGNTGCGGGGVYNWSGGLQINDSTISNNQTQGQLKPQIRAIRPLHADIGVQLSPAFLLQRP